MHVDRETYRQTVRQTYTLTHTYTHIHTYIHQYIHTHTHTNTNTHTHKHTHIHTHTYTHTNTHTHTHTHTHTLYIIYCQVQRSPLPTDVLERLDISILLQRVSRTLTFIEERLDSRAQIRFRVSHLTLGGVTGRRGSTLFGLDVTIIGRQRSADLGESQNRHAHNNNNNSNNNNNK